MRVGLIGAGNMARAMARGWGDPVLCSDGGSGRAQALAAELGGRAASSAEVAGEADLVVLCHKPYQLEAVAAEVAGTAPAVASVLGAVTIEMLRTAYPDTPVYRLEPNTPVEIGRGVVVHAADPAADDAATAEVLALFERLGTVLTIPEERFGAAGAVNGVGPAYVALLAEAWTDAAIRHGLTPALAGRLVNETIAGAAALIDHRGLDTLAVRREVTSPGGSTARGLDALERHGLRAALSAALDAVDR